MKKWFYYLSLSLFAITLFLGYSLDVSALTTKTIYSDLALSNSNKYNYGYTNAGGIDDVTTGSVGTRINGKTKYIGFYLSETTSLNYTYTIRINFLSDDLQPYFSLNYVRRIETCNSSACSNASIIAIRKQNNNGYSTWVELDFNPTQTGSKIGVVLGNDNGNYITGETYFGISSVQIESKNANQDVINNATNNTNNIINNNNSNTENIINNNDENTQDIINNNDENTNKIIEDNKKNFNDCRDSYNLFNKNNVNSGFYSSNGSISSSTNWSNQLIQIKPNTDYTISGINTSNTNAYIILFNSNNEFIKTISTYRNNTFNTNDNNSYYIGVSVRNTDLNTFQLQEGSVATNYEPYGEEICVNKLDEQNKTSKGILGKLGDLLDYFNPLSENWFVKKLVDLLIDGIKALFVPNQEELSTIIDNFKASMETKLGAIYQVADLLVSVLRSILSPASSNSCMTFPEIKDPMFDKLLIEQTDYCFDSLRSDFGFVFTLSDMIISIVCTLAFANMLYKKYEAFIGGNSSDY